MKISLQHTNRGIKRNKKYSMLQVKNITCYSSFIYGSFFFVSLHNTTFVNYTVYYLKLHVSQTNKSYDTAVAKLRNPHGFYAINLPLNPLVSHSLNGKKTWEKTSCLCSTNKKIVCLCADGQVSDRHHSVLPSQAFLSIWI